MPSRLLPSSLKTRVALFTSVLFIVVIWGMAYHSAQTLRRDMKALLSSQQYTAVSDIAEGINYGIEIRLDSLKLIADAIPRDWKKNGETLKRYLSERRAIYKLMEFGLVVLRDDGACLADFPVHAGRQGTNYAERDFFREVLATGKPAFSKPHVSRTWGLPAIVIAVPIKDEAGNIAGVLAGSMMISKNDVFHDIAMPKNDSVGGILVVAPRDRLFITATDKSRILQAIPQDGANRMLDRYLAGFEGSGITVNSRGVEELTSSKRVPSTGWLVIGDMPTEKAFAPILALQRDIYREAALASLLIALLIWLFVHRLLAPLSRAAAMLSDMTGSNTPFRAIPINGSTEIRQLLESFNQLQARILSQQENLHQEQVFSETLIDSLPGLFARLDREQRLVDWNTNFELLVGYDGLQLAQAGFLGVVHPADRERVVAGLCSALENGHDEGEIRILDGNGECRCFHIIGKRLEFGKEIQLLLTGIDITYENLQETREQVRNRIFELLAGGGELKEILHLVVEYVERTDPHMLCCILLLDHEKRLHISAAPSLPDFYNHAVDGMDIGEGMGSCGTCAFRNERVVIEDIREHRYWASAREVVAKAGLASCWSEPIRDSAGNVLGTFAIYHRQPCKPSAANLELIHRAANLASIAIEKKHAEADLQLASSVYQASGEAIVVTDAHNRIVAVNPAFTRVTGYTRDEVRGQDPKLLKSGRTPKAEYEAMWQALVDTDQWQGEIWNRRKNGEEYAEWLTINTLRDEHGEIYRRIAMFSDITEKKRTAELVWRQANYDTLTGLPNRNLFHDRLQQEIRKTQRAGQTLALLFIDLDRFKEVNDTLGHDAGDFLLKEAAGRIIACVRESDTVARLGGDEFTIVLPDLANISRVEQIAQTVVEMLALPFDVHGKSVYISASIGIALCPTDAEDVENLLKSADQAMYAAKEHGRNGFSYFTESMQLAAQTRMQIGTSLRDALAGEQFQVYYQPVVDLSSGHIVKAEALLRWLHPEHGMIGPAAFIPLAEETGLINEIGDWVFKESARMAKRWSDMEIPHAKVNCPVQISINKSPRQFASGKTHESWLGYLREIDLPAHSVVLEITEGLLLDDHASVTETLNSFRDSGVQVALDDFGTGYSAMAYLKKFHIDYVKIDQSFVRGLTTDHGDRVIVEAIIAMAHKLELKVIAEGVETIEQRDMLIAASCDYAQGYLFAHPLPGEEFERLLVSNNLKPTR
ncbi:MAG: EAL domain-containing protein [Sulfuricella sp.]|nr:EAL domain-containing protein [Sulfuricella sp.]